MNNPFVIQQDVRILLIHVMPSILLVALKTTPASSSSNRSYSGLYLTANDEAQRWCMLKSNIMGENNDHKQ